MNAERPDDTMVEIGDIEEEPTSAPEPPARVVIEYRDRGVPWMLVPPFLVMAVVVAVVVALNLNARWNPRRPTVAVAPTPATAPDPAGSADAIGTVQPADQVLPTADVPDPRVVENPPSLPVVVEPPKLPGEVPTMIADPIAQPTVKGEVDPLVPVEPTPAPAPKVALGFDPKALVNPPPDVPAVDRDQAVAQAGQPGVAAPAPNPPDQADQVDPDLLPPDPRRAQFDRQKRAVAARRKLEAERAEFHTRLLAITNRLGRRAAPAIHELCQEFEQEIPASALEQAKKALGKTGMHAGARTAERIGLLRQLGFPETAILGDLFDIDTRHESPEGRHTPSQDEMYVRSAMLLLNNPPTRAASSTRAVSAPRSNPRAKPAESLTGSNR